jgi:hypothetical protein
MWNATDCLSFVGEVASSDKTIDSDRFDVHTTMGGVRFRGE